MPLPHYSCYFYDGCRFHDCFCQKQRQIAEDEKLGERRRKRDYAIRKKLEAQGHKVVVMRECVWYRRKREDEVRKFLSEHLDLPPHSQEMTEAEIIDEIEC